MDDCGIDELLFLQLLAYLQGNVDGAYGQQGGLPVAQFAVVHRHLGQVYRHLLDEVVLRLRLFVQSGLAELHSIEPVAFLMLLFALPHLRITGLQFIPLLNEVQGTLLLLACFRTVLNLYAEYFIEEMLQEIEDRWRMDLVLYYLEDLPFLSFDVLDWDLLLRYLFVHCLHTEWVDVLEL